MWVHVIHGKIQYIYYKSVSETVEEPTRCRGGRAERPLDQVRVLMEVGSEVCLEYGNFPGRQVGGKDTAKSSLCKGNGLAPMELRVLWLLSCCVIRCWESGEEFLSRGQS